MIKFCKTNKKIFGNIATLGSVSRCLGGSGVESELTLSWLVSIRE